MLHSRPALSLLAVLAIGLAACNAGASPSVAQATATGSANPGSQRSTTAR